jgi:hypothetical protein
MTPTCRREHREVLEWTQLLCRAGPAYMGWTGQARQDSLWQFQLAAVATYLPKLTSWTSRNSIKSNQPLIRSVKFSKDSHGIQTENHWRITMVEKQRK